MLQEPITYVINILYTTLADKSVVLKKSVTEDKNLLNTPFVTIKENQWHGNT
jgi:hypothetical protein